MVKIAIFEDLAEIMADDRTIKPANHDHSSK